MNEIDLSSLDENTCKAALNALAKKAYGEQANIYLSALTYYSESLICYNVILNVDCNEYFMLGFIGSEAKKSFYTLENKDFSWRKLLQEIFDFIKEPDSYVSYSDTAEHLIDNSTFLEEVLVNIDLKHVE